MFAMPFHHPARDYATVLEEDQEAIVLADRLGFTEAFVGEHFSSWSERITSPLIFLATLVSRTTQIRLGTGVINLPQIHPATVAAQAAMFDHLSGGRFIMGIGPGGLASDLEMFAPGPPEQRPAMVLESIDTILKLWSQDPPYRIDGQFWKFSRIVPAVKDIGLWGPRVQKAFADMGAIEFAGVDTDALLEQDNRVAEDFDAGRFVRESIAP